jgi:uncharacterized protein YjbJ (UPF0337 family)
MDKDRITGAAKRARGAIKALVGRITRSPKLEAEGRAERTAHRTQDAPRGGGPQSRP